MKYRPTRKWHFFDFSREECARRNLWLSLSELERVHKRNGVTWVSARGTRWSRPLFLNAEMYFWLRENVGHTRGETWSCDRWYYPGEPRPELPKDRSFSTWIQQFERYPSLSYRWVLESGSEYRRHNFKGVGAEATLAFRKEIDAIAFKLRFSD